MQVIRGMLAHKADYGNLRPAGIVQIRQPIAEAGTEMQQGTCRLLSHARIAVRRSSHNPFEEAKHAAHCWRSIERSDQMNLRSSGVGEADFNASGNQRAN
jgi:hypothetical protein